MELFLFFLGLFNLGSNGDNIVWGTSAEAPVADPNQSTAAILE